MTLRLDLLSMKSTEADRSSLVVLRALPIDLLVVVAFVLAADALVSTVTAWPFLRVLVGVPFLFFLPGYVVLAVLFPAAGSDHSPAGSRTSFYGTGSLPFPTRIALSFGVSVSLLPVYGVLLALSPFGFTPSSILLLLTAHVLLGALLGAVRRLRLPRRERFHVPAGRWLYELVGFLTAGSGRSGTAVNVLLVVTVLLAASGFAYAVFAPPDETEYADFMLLARGGDGEFVSGGYPTNFTRGIGQELVVGVANHRAGPTDYTVVVELQRIRGEGEDLQIVERSELGRYGATVQAGETWYRPHDVSPDLAGEDLRLVYYLYRGDAPAEPSIDDADDYLQLWIDVGLSPGSGSGG